MKTTIPDEVRFLIMDDPSINAIRPDNHGFDGAVETGTLSAEMKVRRTRINVRYVQYSD